MVNEKTYHLPFAFGKGTPRYLPPLFGTALARDLPASVGEVVPEGGVARSDGVVGF